MIVWVVQIFWRAIMPTVSKGGQLSPVALKENWNLKKRFSMIAEIDEDIKSKKIDKALNDMSRFDIYTVGRIFHLKSENDDSVNSEKWISML